MSLGWFPALTSPEEFRRDMDKLMVFGRSVAVQSIPGNRECYCSPIYMKIARLRGADGSADAGSAADAARGCAARCLVGPVAECLEKLHRLVEAGCVKYVLRPTCPPAEVVSQLELYGTKILPQFI
jgi:hypothetical protein